MFEVAVPCFNLSETFIKKYKNKQPEWGPIGYFSFKRTYAREIDNENRTEEYWEACRRVVEGTFSIQKNHCKRNHLPWDEKKAQRSAKKMFELMWDFKFLPPGRGLWAMGTDAVLKKGGAVLNNCSFTSTKDIDKNFAEPFTFLMDMSMLGVGVGFDTLGAGKVTIRNIDPVFLPSKSTPVYEELVSSYNFSEPNNVGKDLLDEFLVYVVPDTREGWLDVVRTTLLAYANGTHLPSFIYTNVRKAGEPIKTFGGLASGPEPLIELQKSLVQLFENRIDQTLSSVDITDIMNFIGKAVVAGNVRRSSEIAFSTPDDKDFVLMKQDKEKLISHRWNSNNSVLASLGQDYEWLAQQTTINGEPGYLWMENARAFGRMIDPPNYKDQEAMGANPCSEQTLFDKELCCLVETFPARHENLEEYLETLKIAYLYGKTVTLVPTHYAPTNAVMTQNRRIGTSQSGIIRAFKKHGRRNILNWCNQGYRFLKSLDTLYSGWLGIPSSIKITSVKPSGTVSLLPGEPPGIHYPHSQFYIRRIRIGIHSPLIDIMSRAGYHIEPAVGQEESTVVISFPVKEEDFDKGKKDASVWEQVSNAVAYQRWWSDNQVSITVSFSKEEARDIHCILELYEDSLKSISFLPLNDHGYVQAPYEEIDKKQYDEMVLNLKPVNYGVLNSNDGAPKFCDGDACEL